MALGNIQWIEEEKNKVLLKCFKSYLFSIENPFEQK